MTEDWVAQKQRVEIASRLKGPGGQEGSAPEGRGISDLMSSEYVRFNNFRFTSSSSELSPRRITEGNTTKAKLRTPHSLKKN